MSGQKQKHDRAESVKKIPTGVEGFDDLTHGGLPANGATVLMGGAGCGKTVLALQTLVSAARNHHTAGIFVTFEEDARRVAANGETFGWAMAELEKDRLSFVDASLSAEVVQAGAFDLMGLLAGLEAKAKATGAKIIVFDAIDVLLSLLNDAAAEYHELYRIHQWLQHHEFTGIITTKIEDGQHASAQRYGFIPFMADCVVLLNQRLTDRVAVRTIRVVKYRSSSHVLNEVPFVIGRSGVEVGSANGIHPEPQPFQERVSTGVAGLDEMLGGGFYRGTNVLITGSSGAGKSTLSGAFVAAACEREERVLFISFDENSGDIVRDLATVNIQLAAHLTNGLLRMEAIRTEAASSEEHFMHIKRLIAEHQPRCMAIDPVSAIARVGGNTAARAVAERLIYLCRNAGISVLFTSLLEGDDPHLETTSMHISTIADSWIQITYALQDGERNRALSIIKSRGSKHSNQLRELIFSESGIALADPYAGGGEVLLGTLRLERERKLQMDANRQRHQIAQERRALEQNIAERDEQIEAARQDLRNPVENAGEQTTAALIRAYETTQQHHEAMRTRRPIPGSASEGPQPPAPRNQEDLNQ